MMHDMMGIAGWKWVMFLEGGGSVLVGLIALAVLVSRPQDARWLTAQEKQALINQLAREDRAREQHDAAPGKMALLTDRRLLTYCLIFFTMTMTGYTLVFWLPQIIQRIQGFSSFGIGLLTAIPRLCAIIALNIVGRYSDRYRDKLNQGLGVCWSPPAALLWRQWVTRGSVLWQ